MKILIVDNGSIYLDKLKRLVQPHNFQVASYADIDIGMVETVDAVVLSGGGSKFRVVGNEDKLAKEIEVIKGIAKPVFGICFGFEVIARVFGAKLKRMEQKELGILDIQVTTPDEIFLNLPNFKVFENHRWVVEEAGDSLTELARSKDGIEAVKHKEKPIYGVQFHPEAYVDETCGDEIFGNFLKLAER